MTRAEQTAEQLRKAKEKTVALERRLKEETRKADNQKRYHWGAIAQEAGLFGWGTCDWLGICAALARLKDTPNPAAVLEGLLSGASEFRAEKLLMHLNQPVPAGDTPSRGWA